MNRLRTRIQLLLTLLLWISVSGLQAQTAASSGCFSESGHQVVHDLRWLGKGIEAAPRNAILSRNLKWELPIAATTGVLISSADVPASRRIHSTSLQQQATRWSNIGIGLELGAAGLTYGVGCGTHRNRARDVGLTAVEAAGAALAMDELVKHVTNRQRPNQGTGGGEFWEGGSSFASGHAAASFALASAIAHRYPHNGWLKWGAYGFAAGVALSRFPAKQHFLSDILVGGTLGYVTGTYLATPH